MALKKIVLFYFLFVIKSFGQIPKLVLPIGHTGSVNYACFSPNGKLVASKSDKDFTIKIWDVATGKLIQDLFGHTALINSIEFCSDGEKLLSGSRDSTSKIWNLKTGAIIFNKKVNAKAVKANFSSNGSLFVTFADTLISVWNTETGDHLVNCIGHKKSISHTIFSSDNKELITTSRDNIIRIWNLNTGKQRFQLYSKTNFVTPAQFSLDNQRILSISKDTLNIWNNSNGKNIAKININSKILEAKFTADSTSIVTLSEDNIIRIFNCFNGKLITQLTTIPEKSNAFSLSNDGQKVITINGENSSKIWNLKTGSFISGLKSHERRINSVQFSFDDRMVVTTSIDNTIKIWDAVNGELVADLKGHTFEYGSAHFSKDGKTIITGSTFGKILLWDTATGEIKGKLEGHEFEITKTDYSNNGDKVITNADDLSTKIWDSVSGKLLLNITGGNITFSTFSPNDSLFATASRDKTAKIRNARTGLIKSNLVGHTDWVNTVNFNSNGKWLVSASRDGCAKIWDVRNGELIFDLNGHGNKSVNDAKFSPNSKYVITVSDDGKAIIWNAISGNKLFELIGHKKTINEANFSADGNSVITVSDDNTVKIWDVATGILKSDLNKHKGWIKAAKFSADNKLFATNSPEETSIKIWNFENRNLLFDLNKHLSGVNSVDFSADNKRIITTSKDNTCKVWNAKTGELIYTFFSLDSLDYFCQLPSGYYKCSQNASKLLHYVSKDMDVISFEQLDVKYNRPDLVLKAIGSNNTTLINSYHSAYSKRIRKLGLDTTRFSNSLSLPKSYIANRDKIQYLQKIKTLNLKVLAISEKYLERMNVWLNEIPIYGKNGIKLSSKKRVNLDTTIQVTLSTGKNIIEVSVYDVNGLESYRMPLLVNYVPDIPPKSFIHFVGIGIDKFSNATFNLKYSVKDIKDLALNLKGKYGNNLIIDTLFNSNVSINKIRDLKKNLLKTSVNDKVIVAYSGHGLLNKALDYYLATYNVNFKEPEKGGIIYDELENLLDGIPARKKLLLIDACHSGIIDKENLIIQNGVTSKSIKGGAVAVKVASSNNSLKSSFDLMQSVFVNVGKNTGTTVISAAAGTQFALEQDNLRNGVFTHSIINAMNKYPTSLMVSRLKMDVSQNVVKITNGQQQPTYRNELIGIDWDLW
jgi:WD40 repeat protein